MDNLNGSVKIQNRSYIIEPKESPALITQHEVKIDPNRDFSIPCTTIWTENTESGYFGLTWGANSNNKEFFFLELKQMVNTAITFLLQINSLSHS